MTTLVMIHGGKTIGPSLEKAFPGANVAVIYEPGLSSGYDEHTGLAAKYPTLRALLAHFAPSWVPGEPLVLVAFSAGGWALRYYLRDAATREAVSAAVFLDSLYGHTASGQCDLSPYQGVIAYGKRANANPQAARLVMTYSQGSPDPGRCSQAIAAQVGPGPGVFVQGMQNGDHNAQQYTVGPEVVRTLIAPWLGGSSAGAGAGAGGGDNKGALLGTLAFLGVLVVGWKQRWFRR